MSALLSAVPTNAADLTNYERRIDPGRRTIISIYPAEMTRVLHHAGISAYIHPAASKDRIIQVHMNPARLSIQRPDPEAPTFSITEAPVATGDRGYTLITCVDTYQYVMNYERERQEPLPIDAETVATSLVQEWISGRRVEQGSLGIALLDVGKPISDQLNRLWSEQTAYFRSLVHEADALSESITPSDRKQINELHRRAAAWLGIENRPWAKLMSEARMKKCYACAKSIEADALVCNHCQSFLPEFVKKAHLAYDNDTAIVEFFNRVGAAKNKN